MLIRDRGKNGRAASGGDGMVATDCRTMLGNREEGKLDMWQRREETDKMMSTNQGKKP